MKRSALAHAPLHIKAKTKQSARFYARDVRVLMRGGGMEEERADCATHAKQLPPGQRYASTLSPTNGP